MDPTYDMLYNLFAGPKNGFVYAVLDAFILNKPAKYIARQFNKVWNYKNILLGKHIRNKKIINDLDTFKPFYSAKRYKPTQETIVNAD